MSPPSSFLVSFVSSVDLWESATGVHGVNRNHRRTQSRRGLLMTQGNPLEVARESDLQNIIWYLLLIQGDCTLQSLTAHRLELLLFLFFFLVSSDKKLMLWTFSPGWLTSFEAPKSSSVSVVFFEEECHIHKNGNALPHLLPLLVRLTEIFLQEFSSVSGYFNFFNRDCLNNDI
jgi:hypothetical protein